MEIEIKNEIETKGIEIAGIEIVIGASLAVAGQSFKFSKHAKRRQFLAGFAPSVIFGEARDSIGSYMDSNRFSLHSKSTVSRGKVF